MLFHKEGIDIWGRRVSLYFKIFVSKNCILVTVARESYMTQWQNQWPNQYAENLFMWKGGWAISMQSASSSSCDWAVYTQLHGRRAFSDTVTRKIKPMRPTKIFYETNETNQRFFLQLSWSRHKLAHSCQGRGQRSNGAINRNKHFARRFCRGISNLVTPSLTVAELFQKEIWETKKETM